jgi:hypothetical protein
LSRKKQEKGTSRKRGQKQEKGTALLCRKAANVEEKTAVNLSR